MTETLSQTIITGIVVTYRHLRCRNTANCNQAVSLLVHEISTTVLHADIVKQNTAVSFMVITDSTSHHTFGCCGVISLHPAWNISTAAFLRNTFIGDPIPGSTLETVPTWVQLKKIAFNIVL